MCVAPVGSSVVPQRGREKRRQEEGGRGREPLEERERPYLALGISDVGEALGDTYSLGVLSTLLATTLY